MILLAHNGHVRSSYNGFFTRAMGSYLRETYGNQYYVLGVDFAFGTFRARDLGNDGSLVEFRVPPPESKSAGWFFVQSGIPQFVVDLRSAPQTGPVALWINSPLLMRSVGAGYSSGMLCCEQLKMKEGYDGIVFFDTTSSSHPTLTGTRGPLKVKQK